MPLSSQKYHVYYTAFQKVYRQNIGYSAYQNYCLFERLRYVRLQLPRYAIGNTMENYEVTSHL